MSDDRELRKGSAYVLILALLDERDRHGHKIIVLFTVALAAQAVPIARAMRIEPTVALRQE